jgi:hypothetical protein
MSKIEINPKEMIESLRINIMEYDSPRPPVSRDLFPLSLRSSFEIMRSRNKDTYKMETKFYEDVSKYIRKYTFDTEVSGSERIFIIITFIITLAFLVLISSLLIIYLSLNELQAIILIVIIGFPTIFLYLIMLYNKRKTSMGKKHDTDLKIVVQMLIDHAVELIKENNLDAADYPIKIKHNDYEGLTYKKQKNSKYLGYFKI